MNPGVAGVPVITLSRSLQSPPTPSFHQSLRKRLSISCSRDSSYSDHRRYLPGASISKLLLLVAWSSESRFPQSALGRTLGLWFTTDHLPYRNCSGEGFGCILHFISQGPPVLPFYPFLAEGSPTKIDYRKKGTRILTSAGGPCSENNNIHSRTGPNSNHGFLRFLSESFPCHVRAGQVARRKAAVKATTPTIRDANVAEALWARASLKRTPSMSLGLVPCWFPFARKHAGAQGMWD